MPIIHHSAKITEIVGSCGVSFATGKIEEFSRRLYELYIGRASKKNMA
jgi:hypothetical protein